MSVSEQIVVLLALTGKHFDNIPIDKIQEAETALLNNSNQLPAEILKRLFSDKALSDTDKENILKIAGKILAPFQDKPEPDKNKK